MNRAAFFEAAGEFLNWIAHLSCTTECALREAEDHLCRKQEHGPDVKAFIRWDPAAIGEKIEEVMTAFDMLCQAAGREPRFELAFQVLEAPRLVQWELRRRLDGMPPAPPQSSPR
jgi:hypothetical protein